MIDAPHYSAAGASKKAVSLPEALFDGTVNEDLLHRAVITFLSNQRQGTSNTLTRSEVSGGNQKPWRQKGTGRARQGSTRAPHWRHGGIAHGPHPRSYRLGIPKKMPGHMGARNFTEIGLRVVRIDAERNLLFVRGSVPGPMNGLVTVRKQGGRSRHD